MGGHGADGEGDDQHEEKSDGIAGERKIQGKIGISEQEVHADDPHKGGQKPVHVAGGKTSGENQARDVDHGDIGRVFRHMTKKPESRQGGRNGHNQSYQYVF